ncbi:MAG: hypothetical protein ABWK05_08860 [Pyrobaculum sp.]
MKKTVILFAAAALGLAQAIVMTPNVDYLWLGAKWAQIPKYPGDSGVLSLSFYLSAQYVDVSIDINPRCPWLIPLEVARLPSAGPGVVTASIKVGVSALNVTCPVGVYLKASYKASGSSLTDGMEKVEYAEVYIPPYPTAQVSVKGAALIGMPTTLTLVVTSPYLLTGTATLQGQGLRVLSPTGPVMLNGTKAEIPIVVIADGQSPSLTVNIMSRDWLGNPVALAYTTTVSAAPPPPAVLSLSPPVLYANKHNAVNVTIQLPVLANGTAVLTATGGVMPQSSITFPIINGRGVAAVYVYPVSSVVTFTATATYQAGPVYRTEQVSASAAVQQALGGASKVEVVPGKLIAGLTNNVTILVAARGAFNVSVTVSNGATDKPMPYFFGGVDKASASLLVTPLSAQPVTFTINVYHSAGVDQYTVSLPVVSASIFTVLPTPSLVRAGGNRTVVLTVINSGDVAVQKAVVTVSPGSSSVVASTYTFQIGRLAPLDGVQLPISFIVPATFSGAVPFTYTIIYTTELGTTGTIQGSFYIQALQTPAVNITSVSVVPATPEPRRTFYISMAIVNKGFSSVTNLQVEAKTPRGIRPVTSPIYFVGQLDPQQTATVPLSFNATAPGVYEVEFTVSYTDQYGNFYTIPYKLTITVANSTRFFGPGVASTRLPTQQAQREPTTGVPTIGIVVAAAVAATAAALIYTRRRKKQAVT